MKKFNKTISVQVSVDSIANQLLGNINPAFAHADLLAETIIGTSLNKGTLNLLYNSLNGYTNEIDFHIGQVVDCDQMVWNCSPVEEASGETSWKHVRQPMGTCTVVEIDLYADKKLRVEYPEINEKGVMRMETEWVNHQDCSAIPVV